MLACITACWPVSLPVGLYHCMLPVLTIGLYHCLLACIPACLSLQLPGAYRGLWLRSENSYTLHTPGGFSNITPTVINLKLCTTCWKCSLLTTSSWFSVVAGPVISIKTTSLSRQEVLEPVSIDLNNIKFLEPWSFSINSSLQDRRFTGKGCKTGSINLWSWLRSS